MVSDVKPKDPIKPVLKNARELLETLKKLGIPSNISREHTQSAVEKGLADAATISDAEAARKGRAESR